MTAAVVLDRVSVRYRNAPVVHRVSLKVDRGEFVTLLGPSGAGKSALLGAISGIVDPYEGEIRLAGQGVDSTTPEHRGVALVSHRSPLAGFLTAAENVAAGLGHLGLERFEISHRVAESLRLVELGSVATRLAGELNDWQSRRVAIARAIAATPRVLLLDEPYESLGEPDRGAMRHLVRDLQMRLGVTTIAATTCRDDAIAVSDRIAVMLDGRLVQIGRPRDFHVRPKRPDVAAYFGWVVLDGTERDGGLDTPAGRLPLPVDARPCRSCGFRPEAATIIAARLLRERNDTCALRGLVIRRIDLGSVVRFVVALGSTAKVAIEVAREDEAATTIDADSRAEVYLCVLREAVTFFSGGQGKDPK